MYKGGKYCSLQAYGSHQPREELWGQAISCLTDECSEAQEENDPCAKKKPKPQIPIQSVPGGLYRLGALTFLTAAAKQELAPAKYWQETFPGIHLYCQSSAQVSISTPGGTRGRDGAYSWAKAGSWHTKSPPCRQRLFSFPTYL